MTMEFDGLAVTDDVLSPDKFAALRKMIAGDEYRPVHANSWNKVWRLWDGNPHRGTTVLYNPQQLIHWHGPAYPTNTIMDAFIDALLAAVHAAPDVVGSDWAAIEVCPWIYPPGSALSLHWDGRVYTGGFTYFLHPSWDTHWGGELMVLPSREYPAIDPEVFFGDSEDDGIGLYIPPKPNRLVLIGPNRPHRIARVDRNAGSHVRLSVAGFFLARPGKSENKDLHTHQS